MKTSKTILARHALALQIAQIAIVAAIALLPLTEFYGELAKFTELPKSIFWIPLLALLVVINLIVFRRLRTRLVEPTEELVNQTKLGASSIAFKKKSMNSEEDNLKHYIESQALRSADLESEVNRVEAEIERVSEISKITPDEYDAITAKLDLAAKSQKDSSEKIAVERENVAKLEKELLLLRRELKQANRELETAQEETQQFLQSGDRAPLSSILVEKLKTPLSLINNLSWRLSKSWADTPPAQVKEGLEEITRHSEEQLELLKKYEAQEEDQQRDAL